MLPFAFRTLFAEGLRGAFSHKHVDDSQILSDPIVCDRRDIPTGLKMISSIIYG